MENIQHESKNIIVCAPTGVTFIQEKITGAYHLSKSNYQNGGIAESVLCGKENVEVAVVCQWADEDEICFECNKNYFKDKQNNEN